MRVVKSVSEMQREGERLRREGRKIGLVPTMGYLHDGHLTLVQMAKRSSDVVVLSLFVNPTQFAPNEDFSSYPRDFERDKSLAEHAGVDILFCPEASEVYAPDFGTFVQEEKASLILEGKFRPTHFRGVTTVVAKLLNICKPHVAVFGQKDAQQAFIIGKMVRDLNFDVAIVVAPIVRESDGLAMSSRNVYLSRDERRNAVVLHESLQCAEQRIGSGERNVERLRSEMHTLIQSKGSPSVDYIAFVDPGSFREVVSVRAPSVLIALAVRFGKTRLIDNAIVPVP